jgi:hypothetical protein
MGQKKFFNDQYFRIFGDGDLFKVINELEIKARC